ALKKLAVPDCTGYRDGRLIAVPAQQLVPGDVVMLEAGNVVPADVRLLQSAALRMQEAALTGESEAVEKTAAALDRPDLAIGDRRNMAFMGTHVVYGRGTGLVVATGMQTELGKIATLLQAVQHDLTPLQKRLDQVGKLLAGIGTAVAVLIMVVGIIAGEAWQDMVLTAISVAVAVIPEGLPAVVTFTLALGAQRMLSRKALVRKLPAVETLGSVTVICSDKTGTLTENRMTVTTLDVANQQIDLIDLTDQPLSPTPTVQVLLAGSMLCNDATIQSLPDGTLQVQGDPTEGALLTAATRLAFQQESLQRALPRVAELPFDSERKRMTTIHQMPASQATDTPDDATLMALLAVLGTVVTTPYVSFTKGAVDGLLEQTTHVWDGSTLHPLDDVLTARIANANDQLARNGMRVLGVALRPLMSAEADIATVEHNLVFVGLVGMIDPPRPEVRAAVQTCQQAGIRPVMITGDHPLTAQVIARDLGITTSDRVLTGAELNRMDAAAFRAAVQEVSVYARVSPEHKLRIVKQLQQQQHVVAMTGDGVNDAPALKQANIGVAMGITGTDVSKEAADMVLRDDNFTTIVAAVEEGRVIYDNLRRFIAFVVAGNIGKIAVMLLWPVVLMLFPVTGVAAIALLPLHLLWLNLMTDGLLGLGMGVEPAEHRVMQRPPPPPASGGFFSGGLGWQVLWIGAIIGVLAISAGLWYAMQGLPQWQTMIVTVLTSMQIGQALATRSQTESLVQIGVLSNRLMWWLIGAIVSLQIAAVTLPPFRAILDLHPCPALIGELPYCWA
ncbi:MAG: cation-translocating P-type ATPase, partial [Chloroflexaceae bacterium]|nr:cation-translocating P-type ATPase [Chloroflexaceae bacterium]